MPLCSHTRPGCQPMYCPDQVKVCYSVKCLQLPEIKGALQSAHCDNRKTCSTAAQMFVTTTITMLFILPRQK